MAQTTDNEVRVVVLPNHDEMSERLHKIDNLHLRDFHRILLRKAEDEPSPEGVAFVIALALGEMPKPIHGLIFNKLSLIIEALVGNDKGLTDEIRKHFNRILATGIKPAQVA